MSPKKVSQDAPVACAESFGSEELRRLAPWLFSDEVSERINRSLRQTVCHPSPVSLLLVGDRAIRPFFRPPRSDGGALREAENENGTLPCSEASRVLFFVPESDGDQY